MSADEPTDGVTYASYLDLDRILAAQHPRSDAQDELLF
ncbi:MAG: tryptophan 2,3-dioxygenase, partial [Erythrobacteraceae bacterium]|nr:tryptophan 2,3-dioxygenase [Erythrobacteraceae bacterium]